MRYSVIAKELSPAEVERECRKAGGKNIRAAPMMKQVFCELDSAALARLESVRGLAVKRLHKVSTDQVIPAVEVPRVIPPEEVYYTASQLLQACRYDLLRAMFDPPLTGEGSTIVIVDSGIRATHKSLAGRVVHEVNFSDSPTFDDVFDHGTGVAYLAAGGYYAGDAGVAPGASLWNIKVLDDEGKGTEENVVMGLEYVMAKREEAIEQGLPMHDPMRPSIINMSLGSPDDGDPDNPLRVACQQCTKLGLAPVAAAGNSGPAEGTITCPATDPMVVAVGAVTVLPFEVWQYSSRGPTAEGLVKPDFCCFGVNVRAASAESDTSYKIRTGTSFSAPILGGLAALAIELPTRWGEEFMPEPNCVKMVVNSTVKPQGVSLEQDNAYGWGMPWGEALVEYFRPAVSLEQMLMPLISVGMMAGMLPVVMKMVK